MFGYLVLLFTLVPAVELMLLIEIGGSIGAGNTILIIILTGVLGAYLARLQGFLLFQKIQSNLNQGIMPTNEMLDGLMILVGGIVLLTPGFITDLFGFLLLIPWTRSLVKMLFSRKFENMIAKGQIQTSSPFTKPNDGYDDIDIS